MLFVKNHGFWIENHRFQWILWLHHKIHPKSTDYAKVGIMSFRPLIVQEVEDSVGTPLWGPVNTSPKLGPRCSTHVFHGRKVRKNCVCKRSKINLV